MSLRENTLFGFVDRVEMSLDRIRLYEPEDGYYVAFSGGKDSIVLLDLMKISGVKFDAHYNSTTVDPPEVINFIRQHYRNEVKIHNPSQTMWQLIEKQCMPPLRNLRYCCRILKEAGGSGRFVATGVRREESVKRGRRKMVEACWRPKTRKFYLHPIIDWSSEDVWQYIRENSLRYCSLYDEGFKRIGCVLCPYSDMKRDAHRWPKIADAYKRVLSRVVKKYQEKGRKIPWQSGEEMYTWWINKKAMPEKDERQIPMFV